jgi:hypothetical protein
MSDTVEEDDYKIPTYDMIGSVVRVEQIVDKQKFVYVGILDGYAINPSEITLIFKSLGRTVTIPDSQMGSIKRLIGKP